MQSVQVFEGNGVDTEGHYRIYFEQHDLGRSYVIKRESAIGGFSLVSAQPTPISDSDKMELLELLYAVYDRSERRNIHVETV